MLVELTVENVAIIERCQLVLGPGLTVLTGETGAGKSLLVDAIELAVGERADSELVRSGASKASVSVVIDLSDRPDLVRACLDLGIELEDGALYLSREVFAEGRSQCRVSGKLTPVSALRQLGKSLVDLHGQHDHQSLLDASRHVDFLDAWIGAPAKALLAEVGVCHQRAIEARQKLAALRSGMRDRERRLDLLRFQVDEIEGIAPRPGEMAELEAQLSRLRNVESLSDAAALALGALSQGEANASDALRQAAKAIEDVERFDPALGPIAEGLRAALVQAEESAHALSSYSDGIDADPARLEAHAERIDSLRRLRRKYGDDEAAILEFLEQARRELDLLSDAESSEESLAAELALAEAELDRLAGELSMLRKGRALEFASLVTAQLRDLAMEKAAFEVGFRERAADASGKDDVEFTFSANAGEPLRPLSKIASGGEISRAMLAIKTAMAGKAVVPTLIFDEVDAGLGGRAAATVARKLSELARHCQVLVISHLPQIAAPATSHYRIEKVERGGRAVTEVRPLSPGERVDEVARMLAGEHVTESARANAREMIAGASDASGSLGL